MTLGNSTKKNCGDMTPENKTLRKQNRKPYRPLLINKGMPGTANWLVGW